MVIILGNGIAAEKREGELEEEENKWVGGIIVLVLKLKALLYEGGLKSSYDLISAVDTFYQWDPSTTTPIKEVYGLQVGLCWKINLIWSHSMGVFWSAYELLSQPLYIETWVIYRFPKWSISTHWSW